MNTLLFNANYDSPKLGEIRGLLADPDLRQVLETAFLKTLEDLLGEETIQQHIDETVRHMGTYLELEWFVQHLTLESPGGTDRWRALLSQHAYDLAAEGGCEEFIRLRKMEQDDVREVFSGSMEDQGRVESIDTSNSRFIFNQLEYIRRQQNANG